MYLTGFFMQIGKIILISFSVLSLASSAASHAQVVTDLHNFANARGLSNPAYDSPAQGRDGQLYGTATGLSGSDGAVFRFSTNGIITPLQSFANYQTDGAEPLGSLSLGADGNFRGATFSGGTANTGVIFEIAPNGAYTVLHEFNGDGAYPNGAPIQATNGNLYGTTRLTTYNTGTYGTVYEITSAGVFSTIYTQNPANGTMFLSPLIQGTDGNLYATAYNGGDYNCGTIMKLSTSGVLLQYYSFACGATAYPIGALIQATDGNFYGTTSGDATSTGLGTVFKVTRQLAVTTLYSFEGGTEDGEFPECSLTQGTDGYLYGTTYEGGTFGYGTIFRITTSGDYSLLYSFPLDIGAGPNAPPMQHTSGLFYGTTLYGGPKEEGSLYSLDIGLGPFIALVHYTGRIGQPVQILGQGLTGSTAVSINGVAATSFKVVSNTYMTAVVPAGATTGPVVVTTPTGTLTSNHNFQILQ
jgi:uncharacterized repeat protein (TIGR03803 family)